jgi:hypothetical protein
MLHELKKNFVFEVRVFFFSVKYSHGSIGQQNQYCCSVLKNSVQLHLNVFPTTVVTKVKAVLFPSVRITVTCLIHFKLHPTILK